MHKFYAALVVCWVLTPLVSPAWGAPWPASLERVNRQLQGRVVDFTHNHGADRRIWSAALGQKRDLYVYLPPGYDPAQQYPLALYLHGFSQDEQSFVAELVEYFDRAIVAGELPSLIVAVPDGSILGRRSLHRSASFFINSQAGRFEDYLLCDVWNFVVSHFSIRPERAAHALVGASMGGSAAFNLGIKHRERFGLIVGFFPAVNLRYVDCRGRYQRNFDPCCWGFREELNPHEVIARFYGIVPIRYRALTDPLFGRREDALARIRENNPLEVLERTCLQPNELAMFIAYGGRDEFNIDAQVESFLHVTQQRGLPVTVAYDPKGQHSMTSGKKLLPEAFAWVGPLLAPYSPPRTCGIELGRPIPKSQTCR